MSEENKQEWEQGLKEKISALLTRQVTPLQSEFEKLEKAFAEIRANIAPNASAAEADAASLVAHVNQLITDAQLKSEKLHEEQLAEELEKVRAEITINVRQTLEADFERRLAQATADAQLESQAQITGLQNQLAAQLAAASEAAQTAAAPVAGTDYIAFKEAVEEIDAQRTQSETLTALIRRAANFAPRIVFFVVKGGDAVGWKAAGFENGLNDETVRSLAVSTQTPSMLMQALANQNTAVALSPPQLEINLILGSYGDLVPKGSVAIPLVVRGKAAAVLYADSADKSDDAIQLEAIETLMHVASMGIELLPVRRNAEPVRVTAAVQTTPAPAVAEQPVPVRETPPAPVVAPVETPNASVSFDSPSMKFDRSPEPAEPSVQAPEVQESSIETPVSKTAELEPPAVTPEEIASPPVHSADEEAEPRSIFERIKAGAESEPEVPGEAPVTPSAYEPIHESPKANVVAEISEDTDAPTWMRRLETPEPESAPVVPTPEPEQIRSAPLPPTPPPMQRPSLANWGAKERATGDLSSTQPMPFQADTPSVKVSEPAAAVPNFNQPSDPPRYAAPSLSVSTAASETEVRAHNDARRFARLLVSEIKLYNAAKVNEGRRSADLYSRLRDEIDRSRKVYDKRVSPTVAAKFDYFYDELVQTLAEGDPSKLGESCPGPVVVTS